MSLHHVGVIVDDHEGPLVLHIGVEMASVGGQHHLAAGGVDAHRHHAGGMAADMVQAEARRDRRVAFVKMYAAVEDIAHHLADMLDVIGVFQRRMAHARPGGEPHFLFLDMEGGFWKILQPAGVVIMHMGDDDIVDLAGVEAELVQHLGRSAMILDPAFGRRTVAETGVDDIAALAVADHPDEIIQRHGMVMGVAAKEILTRGTVAAMGVFQGENFIDIGHGRRSHNSGSGKCPLNARPWPGPQR